MDIDNLEAGPELDALVHEMLYPGDSFGLPDLAFKHYSTDIAAAWDAIVEMGRPVGFGVNSNGWRCWVGYEEIYGDAPTAPLAICRAALKATKE